MRYCCSSYVRKHVMIMMIQHYIAITEGETEEEELDGRAVSALCVWSRSVIG
jgi:hypothetical protein